MPRKQPSDAELIEYSHHVLYEMEQFSGAVKALASAELDTVELPRILSNALLENVALHARALIEFAYAKPRKARESDYVTAADYLPDWPKERLKITDFLREVKKRADREMLHITRGRSIPDEVRKWQYGRVFNELSDVLLPFIAAVPAEKVEDGFHKHAQVAFPGAKLPMRKLLSGSPFAMGATHSVPTQAHPLTRPEKARRPVWIDHLG